MDKNPFTSIWVRYGSFFDFERNYIVRVCGISLMSYYCRMRATNSEYNNFELFDIINVLQQDMACKVCKYPLVQCDINQWTSICYLSIIPCSGVNEYHELAFGFG
jgi:hypothetical protein